MPVTVHPTIHLNGTSAKELADLNEKARDAVQAALKAVREAAPHQRDYYPQANRSAFRIAVDEHHKRVMALDSLYNELMILALHISDSVDRQGEMNFEQRMKNNSLEEMVFMGGREKCYMFVNGDVNEAFLLFGEDKTRSPCDLDRSFNVEFRNYGGEVVCRHNSLKLSEAMDLLHAFKTGKHG